MYQMDVSDCFCLAGQFSCCKKCDIWILKYSFFLPRLDGEDKANIFCIFAFSIFLRVDMLVGMWQNIKFTSFSCQRKIYTSSHLLLHQVVYFLCQGENLYINCIRLLSIANFLTKVHICTSSYLLWYQVSYICIEYNFSLAFATSSNE